MPTTTCSTWSRGQLIEEVTGQTWEEYVREHVLGRRDDRARPATPSRASRRPNRAFPHARAQRRDARHGRPGAARRARRARPQRGAGGRPCDQRQRHDQVARAAARPRRAARAASRLFSEAAHERDVEAGGADADRAAARQALELADADVRDLCARLGRAGLSRREDHLARRRGVRVQEPSVVLLPRQNVGFAIAINSEDGELVPRADVRAARPLSRPARQRLAGEVAGLQAGAAAQAHCRRWRRPRRSPPRSARRCRSRATPATMPIRGTAISTSASATAG